MKHKRESFLRPESIGAEFFLSDDSPTTPDLSISHKYLAHGDTYKVNAVLQNYAYNKNVFVRYTTDGWKSFKDQKLTYSSTNANGTENWTTTVYDATNSNIEYAVCYQVNGTEFWANNFGANYDGTYYIHR